MLAAHRLILDAPASTANLGAGFDVLALALDLRNVIELEAIEGRDGHVELEVSGEGAGALPADRSNRFVQALELGLREAGVPELEAGSTGSGAGSGIGWRVRMENAIPTARGLGSSASVTVAGLVAADALRGGGVLSPDRILELAAGMEGHPDNAAAALLGGFVVVANVEGRPRAVRFDAPAELRAVLFIPDRPMATSEMRAALPGSVPFGDAVHNVGAAAMAVAAMATGRLDLLGIGTDDRLHEPYRAAVYPELPRLTGAARAAGSLGACLSGAGSSVIAFAADDDVARRVGEALGAEAEAAGLPGTVRQVRPRSTGVTVAAFD